MAHRCIRRDAPFCRLLERSGQMSIWARTGYDVDVPLRNSIPPVLSPIVDDVGAGAAIAGIVLPVHVHALNFGAKSAGNEMPIGFVARHVRTGQQSRHADSDRQSLARVEQAKIIVFGRPTVADRTKFNEASVCASFAAWPVVTHRERRDTTGPFNQNCIAQTLRMRRSYLAGQVETGVNRFSDVPARLESFFSLRLAQLAEARPSGCRLPHCFCRHDCREKTRVKAVFLIEGDMFRAVRECE